jgi:hypothetical protein
MDASNEDRMIIEIRRRRGVFRPSLATLLFSRKMYRKDEKSAGTLAPLQRDNKSPNLGTISLFSREYGEGHHCIGDGRFIVRLLLERSHIAPRRFEKRPITIGTVNGATCEAT